MILNPNELSTNILVTVMTAVMVLALPWLDRRICNSLGLSLTDGVSTNPNSDRLMHLRKCLLVLVFILYLMLVGYVAFFSRSAADDYRIQASLLEGLTSSIQIDFGILGFIVSVFKDGLTVAMTHVRFQHLESIAQVYMNICMFIPMGYLLPYIFDWFRRNPINRPVITGFLVSLLIENIQLLSKLGFYDVDDLLTNTLGSLIGAGLYVAVAYVLTHPGWRQQLKDTRLWRREARKTSMYPFFRKIHFSRTTIYANDSAAVLEFYVRKMGMYLARTMVDEENKETSYLFIFGKNQLEIRCPDKKKDLPRQHITLACNNSEFLKSRLEEKGITTGSYLADSYTGLRTFSFEAPDTVITIIEE